MAECIVHLHTYEQDCDFCKGEMQYLEGRYRKGVDHNNSLEKDLNNSGMGIDPMAFVMTRMNHIVGLIFGERVKDRYRWEMEYLAQCEAILKEAQSQTARAKLLQGTKGARVRT